MNVSLECRSSSCGSPLAPVARTAPGLLLLCLALAGCSDPVPQQRPVFGGVVVGDAYNGNAAVQTIQLEDGTRCAVLIGYRKGAISCDWK